MRSSAEIKISAKEYFAISALGLTVGIISGITLLNYAGSELEKALSNCVLDRAKKLTSQENHRENWDKDREICIENLPFAMRSFYNFNNGINNAKKFFH